MDINEVEVGKRYWWNGRFENSIPTFIPPGKVMVKINDNDDCLPLMIADEDGDECWVSPETLSPLPEHEDE